jgi:hypothetical protein
VRVKSNEDIAIDLGQIGNILPVPIEIGTFSVGDTVSGFRPMLLVALAVHGHRTGVKTVTLANLEEWSELYALKIERVGPILSKDAPFPEIGAALQMLDNLSFQIPSSSLRVLGLFGIIEMMIARKPEMKDGGDSIMRQMRGKIPLVSRLFDSPLPYAEFFGAQTKTETVWNTLYEYRSLVAHGGAIDFTSGKMELLRGKDDVDSFLLIVVHSLLRHALRDPHLYRDLRGY